MKLNKLLLAVMMTITMLYAAADEETVNVNFRNLDVKDFVEMVSKITNKNILINGPLKGKINFVSTQPIKKSSLIPLANAILSNKGFTLVDQGDFLQVVKASEAAGMGLAVDDKISGETLKTVLFKLKTSNAALIRAKIKPLLHKNAKVVSFKNNNVLSITAYPRTLQSIKKIIDSVEGAGKKGSTVIKLRHASAKAVYANAVKMAGQLFPKTIPSEKVNVLKDDATNAIILVGKKENVNKMIRYIKQLDQKGDDVEQKMYVIELKNSNVEDMEKILSKLVSQMNGLASKAIKKGGKPAQKAMVVGDAERNALIVLATGDQIKNIRKVIRSIDVEKPQVYIVAKIVEIDMGKAEQIGVKYGFTAGGNFSGKGLFSISGSTGASALEIPSSFLSFLTDNNSSSSGNTFNFIGNKLLSLGARIDLLKENGAAHILSEPSVLCTNNKESEIYVGQVRSILTSSASGDNKNDVVRNNYSREDIGITLKVKPRLSSRNKVTLSVEANIEDVDLSSSVSADRPTTTKRKVNTNAIVSNGQTIILGGLIKSSGYGTTSKVPILGDLPIIGSLFRSNGKNHSKINVVIYLTPYIVRKSSDLVKLKNFLAKLNGVQKQYNRYIRKRIENGDSTAEDYDGTYHPNPTPKTRRNGEEQDAMRMLGFKRHRKTVAPVAQAVPQKRRAPVAAPVKKRSRKKAKAQPKHTAEPAYVAAPQEPKPVPAVREAPKPVKQAAPQAKKAKAQKAKVKKAKARKETRAQRAARLKREAFEQRKLERKRRWEQRKFRHVEGTPRERRSRSLRQKHTPHSFMRGN